MANDFQRDTSEILKELENCSDFKSFYHDNKEYLVTAGLATMLNDLADSKGLKRSQIFKQAELSENYGYQIFSGIRVPERNKVIMLAFGMGLNLDETQKLLKCADYQTLYVKLPFDSIIVYGLCKGLSVIEVNELLFEYGLSTLS